MKELLPVRDKKSDKGDKSTYFQKLALRVSGKEFTKLLTCQNAPEQGEVSQRQAILDSLGIDISSVKESARDEIITAFSCEQNGEYGKAAKSYREAAWLLYDRIIHGGRWWREFLIKAAENYEKAGNPGDAISTYQWLHNTSFKSPKEQSKWLLKIAENHEKAGNLQEAAEFRRIARIVESFAAPEHPNPLGVIGKLGVD